MEEIEELKKEIQKFHDAGDERMEFPLQGKLGNKYFAEGNLDDARSAYERAVNIAQQLNDLMGMSATLNNLGNVNSERGQFQEAEQYYKQALEIAERLGNLRQVGDIYNNLGLLNYKMGRYDEAQAYYNRALELAKELGDKRLEDEVLNNLSLVASSSIDEISREITIPKRRAVNFRFTITILITVSIIALGVILFLSTGSVLSGALTWVVSLVSVIFTIIAAGLTVIQWLRPSPPVTKLSENKRPESEIVSIGLRMTDGTEHEFQEWITDPDRLRHYIDVFNQPSSNVKPLQVIFKQKNGNTIVINVAEGVQNNLPLNELLSYLKVESERK